MVTGNFKFVVLILLFVFGINMISVQSFADNTSSNIITTSDGYTFNTETGLITSYSGNGGNIKIPSRINGIKVIGIDGYAFSGCTSLKNIAFPGVTYLGEDVFFDCHLESVTIPKTLESYYYDAGGSGDGGPIGFCTIDNIIFEDGTTYVEEEVVAYCAFKNITIPSSVTSIDQDISNYYSSITIITYPGTYADKYAQSNNIPVKYILTTPVPTVSNPVPEDINGDRVVNIEDVILAASHFNTTSSSGGYDIKCDLDNDGYINMIDIMRITVKFNYTY